MSIQLISSTNQRKARRFSPQQKLKIIREWETSGNGMEVSRKYQIHPHTLYRWKKALEQGAETFLSGKRPRVNLRIKELQEENRKLKETLAMQTQELMFLKKRMNLL